MTSISSSTTMREVSAALATLTGDRVSVQEIVDTILQISNFKNKVKKYIWLLIWWRTANVSNWQSFNV